MSELFHKNLETWAHFYPKEAIMLPYLDSSEYQIDKGMLIGPKGAYKYPDPFKWFSKLSFKDETALVIYGVGLGELFPPIQKWLEGDKERRVFFFEEDPHVLALFFETPQAEKILTHPQVEVHWLKELKDDDPALDKFFWSAAMKKALVAISPVYKKWYPERAEEFEHQILLSLDMKNSLIEEYLKYGVTFFRSFYFNMLDLPDSYLGNKLFGKFKDVPAIICGAGPSLEKQIPLLKELKDHAFIIAGGSSLNALSFAGLQPHFSCGLDPNLEQSVRLRTNQAKGMPFFYRNRMHYEAFRLISGPKLYITGSGGYDISDYYEKKLGIESEFIDEGHNVINFLCEIATRLGCNPIIFVGLDLAFTDLKTYAPGVVVEQSLPPQAIKKKDILGNPLWTEWKWVGESLWISKFAQEHPDFTFINATEGGLGIKGIPHLPLKEVAARTLHKKWPLDSLFKKALRSAKDKKITRAKILKWTQELHQSLENCLKKLDVIAQSNSLASGEVALAETELLDEPAYTYILDIFNAVMAHLQNNSLRLLRLGQKHPEVIEKEKLHLQKERIVFLKKVAQVNLKLIEIAVTQESHEED